MNRWLIGLVALVAVAGASRLRADEPQVAHMVYFTLAEKNAENEQKLITACQKFLSGHEGTVYFSVGKLAPDMNRDVNVRDFDVGLHMVFENKAAHEKYQTHPRHLKFRDEFMPLWSKVRVFDAYVVK